MEGGGGSRLKLDTVIAVKFSPMPLLMVYHWCSQAQGEGRGLGKLGKREGGERRGNACNKSPNWFNSAFAGSQKILIGHSDKFPHNQPCKKEGP